MKHSIIIVSLLMLIASGYALVLWFPQMFTPKHGAQAAALIVDSVPVMVQVTRVQSEDLPIVIQTFGSLRAHNVATISSEIAGNIIDISFQEGTFVEAGTTLVALDDAIERATLMQATAEKELSDIEHQRIQQLYARGLQSEEIYDQTVAMQLTKQAALVMAETRLAKTKINAPFTGYLTTRNVSLGDYVAPGAPLVTLVNTELLSVRYHVPERYVRDLDYGQRVIVTTQAYPDTPFVGKVSYISPQVNDNTRTITVEAQIDNDEQLLRPGLSVQVTQQLGLLEDVLVVPEQSIVASIDGLYVYVVSGDRVESVAVKVGARANEMVEIDAGLMSYDIVVTEGQQQLRDGSLVHIIAPLDEDEPINDVA